MMQTSAQIVKWISVIAAQTMVTIRSDRFQAVSTSVTFGLRSVVRETTRVGSRTSAAITASTASEDPDRA